MSNCVRAFSLDFPANLKLAVNSMAAQDEFRRVRFVQIGVVRRSVVHDLLPNMKLNGCRRSLKRFGRAEDSAVCIEQGVTMFAHFFTSGKVA